MTAKKKVWKPQLVVVEWVDACDRVQLSGTLGAVLDRAKLMRRESSGYLLKTDEFLTVLARDYDPPENAEEEPEVGGITVIPTGWVIAIRAGRRKLPRPHEKEAPAQPDAPPYPPRMPPEAPGMPQDASGIPGAKNGSE